MIIKKPEFILRLFCLQGSQVSTDFAAIKLYFLVFFYDFKANFFSFQAYSSQIQ